jgi:hypothetical protein
MAKGYGKGNTYGGGKPATGLGQNSYGSKTAVGYNSASYKGVGRKTITPITDPRAR